MRIFLYLIVATIWLGASTFKLNHWKSGETFGGYLTRHSIDATKFYSKISPTDMELLSEINSNSPFFENISNNTLNEALIPIGEKMQIYIKKVSNEYLFDVIPIKYNKIQDKVMVTIESNFFSDIKKATNNSHLATYLKRVLKGKIDFTKLKKGAIVAIKYSQKSIKKLPWGEPIIEAAYIKSGSKELFILKNRNSYKIWSNNNKNSRMKLVTTKHKVSSKYIYFTKPLSKMRVTSNFTYKRWHPVLHRYRPHLGLDLGSKRGTSIHAIASGKVVYSGWMGGYGRVVKVDHGYGYLSLYAHQSKLLVKRGQHVKAWQTIGKIGSSGRSTGPHLHLGLYVHGKPRNPQRYINRIVKVRDGVISKKSYRVVKNLSKELPLRAKIVYNSIINNKKRSFKWRSIDSTIDISILNHKRVKKHAVRIQLSNRKGDA